MTIDLERPHPLSPQQIADYRRDGFIKLKDVFNADELHRYGEEITRLTIALNTQTLPLEQRSTYDRAFLQVMNLWQESDRVREFVFGRRLAGLAAALLEVDGVRLYHDQSLYKEPAGGITPAHADQYYWPVASDRTITAWIPLQAVPQDMGPLAFFAGSQHVEFGRDLGISDESELAITKNMEAHGFRVVNEPFALGEVSFHSGWTFHRAGPNRSTRARAVMTVIYMDRDMRLKAPENHMQKADWERWCPGAEVGAVIDTPKNPVLFESTLFEKSTVLESFADRVPDMTPEVVRCPAIIADGQGGFVVEMIEVDPPGPDEVRIAIAAAGICHTDHASLSWPGPLVLGHEGAGYVEAIGEGVDGLQIAQPVLLNWAIPCGTCFQCTRGAASLCERTHEVDVPRLGTSRVHAGATRWRGRPIERSFHLGTFTRYAMVRAEAVTPLPPNLSVDTACILGCAVMTGVGSVVNVAAVAPGDSVAVLGCGGVGLNVIQGARIAGARIIIAIDRIPGRLDRARELGATHVLLAREGDTEHTQLVAAVRAITDGRGADHAFEATGLPALAFLPLQLARHGGNAVQVSGAHGPATLQLTDLFWNKRYLAPLYGGCVPSRDFPRLFDWIAQGKLELAALISHRYPMEALDQAFDDMLEGRSSKGVLCIA